MSAALIPESAPFDADQRAWLNGFFAGLLGVEETNGDRHATVATNAGPALAALTSPNGEAQAAEEDEDFPWHDPALPMDERVQLASEKPIERRLMAAMAQLDCGACGYLCRTYSEAIASGEEKSLTLCSPGGKDTAKMLKRILREGGDSGSAKSNGDGKPNRKRVAATLSEPPPSLARQVTTEESQSQQYDRKNPFQATLVSSTNLNKESSAKDTRHVVLDLSGSNLSYEVGDSLGAYPTNCPELVHQIMGALDADGTREICGHDGLQRTLRDTLLKTCNLRDFDEVGVAVGRNGRRIRCG